MLFSSNELEQSTNFMDSLFQVNEQSLQQNILQCEMQNNSDALASQQLHLSNELAHQDFIRRYER